MAENAERTLQDMIPEMKGMEKIGLFTVEETRKIMKKRREFEYKLRRKTKEKKDFMFYIEYEKSVLDLVKHRRNKSKCVGLRKEIDVCIVRRIHKLYELACSRFPGSLEVWKEHIEFCQKRKERAAVEKIFSHLMRLHPHNEDLWVLWANHEMQDNLSPANARQLLQRALRNNPESKKLYKELFCMELQYADKLRKRQEVLNVAELQSQSTILKGELSLVVYKNAVEKFANDVEFCLSFVNLCQPFDFTLWIADYIYEDVEERFEGDEVATAAVAKRPLPATSASDVGSKVLATAMKETCENFENALRKLATERMWELYLSSCIEMAKIAKSSKLANWACDQFMKVFLRAVEDDKVTENMVLCWVDVLSKTGQVQLGLDVIPLLTNKFRRSLNVWIWQLKLQMLCNVDVDVILSTFQDALKNFDKKKEYLSLWKIVTDWCIVSCPDKIADLLEEGVNCGQRAARVFVKESYLDWACLHFDIKSVRKLFKRLSVAPVSLNLFYKYINFELSQFHPKIEKVRFAYESAILEFGSSDIDIWMKYLDLETKHPLGDPAAVRTLYNKARRTLREPLADAFIEQSVRYNMATISS